MRYLAIALLVLPVFASAASLPTPPASDISGLLCKFYGVLGWVFVILILVALVFVLVAAFHYLTSSGEPEKVKKANHTLLWAAVAIAIALFARGFPTIVANLIGGNLGTLPNCFGVSDGTLPGPSPTYNPNTGLNT